MSEAEKIAAGLTEAQREIVLSLPADGGFGRASSYQTAKYTGWDTRAKRSTRLVEQQHLIDNYWCLNSLGLEVREILTRSRPDGNQ